MVIVRRGLGVGNKTVLAWIQDCGKMRLEIVEESGACGLKRLSDNIVFAFPMCRVYLLLSCHSA